MAESARVESIQAIRDFRAAMIEFQDQARRALLEAQGDVERTLNWLDEQQGYWKQELRKREEQVVEARRAVNQKKLYPAVDGSRPSAVEEEQALSLAKRRVEEAEQKLKATRRGRQELSRQAVLFHGALQRLGQRLDADLPRACAQLETMASQLDAYVNVRAPRLAAEAEGAPGAGGMKRAAAALGAGGVTFDPIELRRLVRRYGLEAVEVTPLESVAGTLPSPSETATQRLTAATDATAEGGDVVGDVAGDVVGDVAGAGVLVVAAGPGEAMAVIAPMPGDGGAAAYVGPAGPVEDDRPRWAGPIAELLSARPELAAALGLPGGWVAVVGENGRLDALWDEADEPVATGQPQEQER
ncbi:MAG: hypothetical protein WD316_05555 [Phycisphaeraceae bacterium]